MTRTAEYHCQHCHDNSVTREFDVPHVSRSCESCGEFSRFVQNPTPT